MILLDWLRDNSGAATVVLTLLLTVATCVYVWLTHQLVRENRALRQEAGRPRVSVQLSLHEVHVNIIELVLDNMGGSPALNVRFEILSAPENEEIKSRLGIGLFTRGLSRLASGQRLVLFLANAIGNLEQLKSRPLALGVSYADGEGQVFRDTVQFDFAELEGFTRIGKPPLYEIATNLKSLEETVSRLSRGWSVPKVVAYSPDELRREQGADLTYAQLCSLPDEARKRVEALIAAEGADRE